MTGRTTFDTVARELLRLDAGPSATPSPRNLYRLILGNGKRKAALLAAVEVGQMTVTVGGKTVRIRACGDHIVYSTTAPTHDEFVGIVGNVRRNARR